MNDQRVAEPLKDTCASRSLMLSNPLRRDGAVELQEIADEGRGRRVAALERRAAHHDSTTAVPAAARDVLGSPGRSLDPSIRSLAESRFHRDFSGIRIHTGAQAVRATTSINARAYAVGKDIVLGVAEEALRTDAGQGLLFHELAHTIQQEPATRLPLAQLEVTHPNDPADVEAETAARSIELNRAFGLTRRQPMFARQVAGPQAPTESTTGMPAVPMQSVRAAEAPEELPIDGSFWIVPPGVRSGSVPLFDEENKAVIGFRYSSGGFWQIFDLDGNLVETGEIGLEQPLIDPIDLLAGGIVGLFRGGGVRAGARVLGGAAERAGAEAAATAGARSLLRVLGRRALDAVRATYRAIRLRGTLSLTETAARHMAEPGRRVPMHILKLAIRYGSRSVDPQGVAGAFRYVIPMFRNGKLYTLEVVLREADRMILHFLYR